MNVTRAFSFVFDDPDWWQPVLVVGLLQLVPVIGQIAALGCVLFVARAVVSGHDRPLPRLNQFGLVFSEGLKGALIAITYYLPVFLLVCLFVCFAVAVVVATGNDQTAAGILVVTVLCLNVLLLPLSVIIQVLLIVGSGNYVASGTVGSALQIGGVLSLFQRNPAEWLVLWLLSILCNVVAGMGAVGLVIGALFTTAYAALVFGHLLGQAVRQVSSPLLQE
ncbi:DUF4013 domain-containing protein [Chloroflexus sp.]|uniref:DUF4013 domain-containing protein n=1 Tax=Chloroflexus sp. TaxID=1904827 RepID=UPI002604D6BA|nr:DUF4013 domain-containing protein [uncultured Chloroflexus sp.]